MDGRRQDDEAEGLWRINDNLYDLTDFIKKHPGGADWLIWTQGTDITEPYESHHLSLKPDAILPTFFIREAKNPRNLKFTMHDNGFFKVLKKRVVEKLAEIGPSKQNNSKRIIDTLFLLTLTLASLAGKYNNYLIATATGMALTWTIICAHNYFHQRDNWRMKLFNLSLMSYREWRISHSLSHHMYPNTLHDLEISTWEPILPWMPSDKMKPKGILKYYSWVISPIVWGIVYHLDFLKRIVGSLTTKNHTFHLDDIIIPLLVPASMFFLGGNKDLWQIFKMWNYMIWFGAFMFSLIGLNAAHHHPDVPHAGDALK